LKGCLALANTAKEILMVWLQLAQITARAPEILEMLTAIKVSTERARNSALARVRSLDKKDTEDTSYVISAGRSRTS